jgi:hypothetical protein
LFLNPSFTLSLEQLTEDSIRVSSIAELLYIEDMQRLGHSTQEALDLLDDALATNTDFDQTYISQRNSLMDAPYAKPLNVKDYIVKADDITGLTSTGIDLSFEKPNTKIFLSDDKQVLGKVTMRKVGGNIAVHEEQYAPMEEVVESLCQSTPRKIAIKEDWQKYVTAGLATLAFFTLTDDLHGQAHVDVHTIDHEGSILPNTQVYLRDIDGVLVDSLVTDASR